MMQFISLKDMKILAWNIQELVKIKMRRLGFWDTSINKDDMKNL